MEQAKKKKKKIVIIVVILIVLVVIIGGFVACSRMISTSLEMMGSGLLETSEVEKRDIEDYISVSGQVESENMVKITSTLTAKVKSIHVEVGSEVKEGDILCEFDSTDLQSQYDSLLKSQQNADLLSENNHRINERNLENAKTDRDAALAQAQRGIDEAVRTRDDAHKKEADLVNQYNQTQVDKGNLINQMNTAEDPDAAAQFAAQVEAADLRLQTIDSQLQAIREQFSALDSAVQSAKDAYASTERSMNSAVQSYQDVLDAEQYSNSTDSTQSELEKLRDMIDQCTVRAPKSGIVTSLNIAEGSIPTTDALMTIENTDALKITVAIAESDILKIHQGMKATVKTTATGDEEFSATVSRVVNIYKAGAQSMYGAAEEGGYSAEITIDDADTDLLIGMTARVKIILQQKEDVVSVPFESIVEDEDGSYHVVLAQVQGDGTYRAKFAKVEPGMEGTYYTEITSDEVKEGDKVVLSPGDYEDGAVLPIFDFNAAANSSADDEGDADE